MPAFTNQVEIQKKRKRETGSKKRIVDEDGSSEPDYQSEILLLESKVLESRKNYNNISTLLEYVHGPDVSAQKDAFAAVALCRVFCRLMAAGSLSKTSASSDNERTVLQWLSERLKDYKSALIQWLGQEDPGRQSIALTLLMRTMKEEANHLNLPGDAIWNNIFRDIVTSLLRNESSDAARTEFLEKYVEEYDDVRFYTFARLTDIIAEDATHVPVQNALDVLAAMETVPEQQSELEDFFLEAPPKKKHDLYSLTAHKKQGQRAWMAVLRQQLNKTQRKLVLELMSHRIAPWFLKVELLMDFLTDSFNVGGSTSLMALSGLFYLIQHKNLDYPQFYHKLYSLLDENILHSKHRSRFFRLLDTFLASTHLPAALVASFIKRLSRLCLHAPPSGIVVIVPWVYNLLKSHPTCTFMIHRHAELPEKAEDGWGDPYNMDEPDPMETDAIESSLWEIGTLQSHYHPNVATIAKIISEQFTKHAYTLEDFLDHSYATMLDAELSKDIRKPPEIEYEIPKRIFLKQEAAAEDSMLVKLWNFG